MKCAVITPIGPGHRELYKESRRSVIEAMNYSKGIFQEIVLLPVDDADAKLGRSKARNIAVRKAYERGIEWVFFLDADDFLLQDAFDKGSIYLGNYDAIWGTIAEIVPGARNVTLRVPQLLTIHGIAELAAFDPGYTIQIGHFVKTEVVAQMHFDEQLDAGEDFDYYLRIWDAYKCIKVKDPFFVNRRGRSSTGNRSAGAGEWRNVVIDMISTYRKKHGITKESDTVDRLIKLKSSEYAEFSKLNRFAVDRMFEGLAGIFSS